jgi:type I restriction enzyme M protein
MNQSQYNQLFSFLFNIANDVLVQSFNKGDYKKIILPFIVLRRLDLLLEESKQQVINFCQTEEFAMMPEESKEQQLCFITKYPFYNVSPFTMKMLKAETDQTRLRQNFEAYLDGFSLHVQDIIAKFDLRHYVQLLSNLGCLGMIIEKMTADDINLGIKPVVDENTKEIKLPPLDNHTMGTLFEDLLRKFNEDYSVTEAGEHYTPRDYVKLLADLAFIPVADRMRNGGYEIYDGACGTGGILSVAQDRLEDIAGERGMRLKTYLFGQELQPETFATCKADLMLSGHSQDFTYRQGGVMRYRFVNGSTISDDGHPGKNFDFCISNPPFGTPWKKDFEVWGSPKKKEDVPDTRFSGIMDSKQMTFVPNIGDPQMLFLANNVSRMKEDTELGTRIVEIHNGSSLFTGNAGGGESNLRRYIIENDMLEAIVAMPENMFYNTGIGTFVWIVTNRKEERRRGKVQLIDATSIKTPLRKNLGNKNCEASDNDRAAIVKLLTDFVENDKSKIFDNREFGFWQITVDRPLRQSISLSIDALQKTVNSFVRKDVSLSDECIVQLMQLDIDIPLQVAIPEVSEDESIFDSKFARFRKMKLAKTTGQIMADMVLSCALTVLCDMLEEKTEWLDVQEFEEKFNSDTRVKQLKFTWSKIEDVFLYISKKVNPDAKPVVKDGKLVPDPALRDTEQVPLLYQGGIEEFMRNEVLPYAPDAFVDDDATVIGYELSFTKYFYKPIELRTLKDIREEIRKIESRTDGLLNEILGE